MKRYPKSTPSHSSDRSRRGSILIFVVGILVLLALAATAFLATARGDRVTTTQNGFNTEIELLLQGMVNAIDSKIMADARLNETAATAANGYDSPISNAAAAPTTDAFLASRTPVLWDTTAVLTNSVGLNPAKWNAISGPLFGSQFSDPFGGFTYPTVGSSYVYHYNMIPTTLTIGAQTLPGLMTAPGSATVFPAMDTDQDGIADALMSKVSVGPVNGLTYFCGVRVVDNNSAINANTAWAANDPTVGTNPLTGNFFPSNVDLVNGLTGTPGQQTTQITSLNNFRTGGVGTFNLTPYDDQGNPRADFVFAGINSNSPDALWNELGRRLNNPGLNGNAATYAALDASDGAALASHFVVRNSSNPSTTLETALSLSLQGDGTSIVVPSQAYASSDSYNWFLNNFNFATSAGNQSIPLRSVLTTSNAVGNDVGTNTVAPSVLSPASFAVGTTYTYGQVVSFSTANSTVTRNFVCIQPHTATATNGPDSADGRSNWSLLNWAEQPQKINVNTSDFGELWWGFRRVMAGTVDQALATPPYDQLTNSATQGRMFRNTVRDPAAYPDPTASPHALSSSEMLQVRSALAAVNTMDLRDGDDDITARQISTFNPAAPATVLHKVVVYGTERQPYITEVYVDTGSGPYVAVELYNPYPVAMSLNGWGLGVIKRDAPYPLTMTALMATPLFANTVVVPAQGYLLLASDAAAPSGVTLATGVTPTVVAELKTLVTTDNQEMVLVRPRKWDITGVQPVVLTKSTSVNDPDPHDEGTYPAAPNLCDFVPIDSFDFSGMTAASTKWHYVRANDATAAPSKWTIAGPYVASGLATVHQAAVQFAAAGDVTVNLGMSDPAATFTDAHTGLQIHATDWPSPRSATSAAGNLMPFGSFAREADMLQIPYIGGYKVSMATDTPSVNFTEINALPLDASFADDQFVSATEDTYEQIGRFCTLATLDPITYYQWPSLPATPTVATSPEDYYDFARHVANTATVNVPSRTIFDIFTTSSPQDQSLPAVSADEYIRATNDTTVIPTVVHDDVVPAPVFNVNATTVPGLTYGVLQVATSGSSTTLVGSRNIPASNASLYQGAMLQIISGDAAGQMVTVQSVTAGSGATGPTITVAPAISTAMAAGDAFRLLGKPLEHTGTQGLININTAPWFVLARLPMVLNSSGQIDQANNDALAKLIVAYRDGNAAFGGGALANGRVFQSIMDLNRVVDTFATTPTVAVFQTANNTVPMTADYAKPLGDLSPEVVTVPPTDGVVGDFENRYLMLSRICNLITTRSDTYTVYLELQGWRDAGSASAQMVTDRHLAFIVDRSALTPVNTSMSSTKVPQ